MLHNPKGVAASGPTFPKKYKKSKNVRYLSAPRSIKLHPGQHKVFVAKSRFKVVVAGRRFGKTVLSKTIIIQKARKANQLLWYIAPTYKQAKQIMWRDLKASIPKEWLRKPPNETSLTFELINGTVIELKGADKPDSLLGVGLHYVVMDEFQSMRPEVWKQAIRPTLATTGGGALFIGTPRGKGNHLYDVYRHGKDPKNIKNGSWMSWHFLTKDSPFVPAEEIEAARLDLDPKMFSQEFEADFSNMTGAVYYPFDRDRHVEKLTFNPRLPIWIGQDFNIDPMASAVMQFQDNGEIWIIDEIVLQNSNTEEVCAEIERRYWRYSRYITIYPDAAGAQRQHARGETDLDIMRMKGFGRIKVRRRNPAVADRVNSVNRMLMNANGDVRLKVHEDCKHVIGAFEQVAYKEGSRQIDKSMNIEHISDAIGYCIEYEFPIRERVITGIDY